ncbi:11852_t:CDS:2 [Rhizophagus irregularis]|nr:11852_t:CDS:2 [Rhizophagus irregularis]
MSCSTPNKLDDFRRTQKEVFDLVITRDIRKMLCWNQVLRNRRTLRQKRKSKSITREDEIEAEKLKELDCVIERDLS